MRDAVIELAGIVLYLLLLQHLMATYAFEKPEDSWLRIGWIWLRTRRERYFQTHVAPAYNRRETVDEPRPKPSELEPDAG